MGRRRCVRLRTMSRNSWDVGTGWISFHVVFIVGDNVRGCFLAGVGDGQEFGVLEEIWHNIKYFRIFTASLSRNLIA